MADCLSVTPLQSLSVQKSGAHIEQLNIKKENDCVEEHTDSDKEEDFSSETDKMVMLENENKDSATLLRDILQSEKKTEQNNNAGEDGEASDEAVSIKNHSVPQSPMSTHSQSETEDLDEEPASLQKRHRVEDIVLSRLTPKPAQTGSERSVRLNQSFSPRSSSPNPMTTMTPINGNVNVNGCKKRKLYQPSRQHVDADDTSLVINDDDDNELDDELPVKRSEDRDALRARLKEHFDRFNGEIKHLSEQNREHRLALAHNADLERLVSALKSEITHTLTQVIDDIVSRFVPRFTARDDRPLRDSNERLNSASSNNSNNDRCSSPSANLASTASNFDLSRPESLLSVTGQFASLGHSRDLNMLSQMFDRKAKAKVIDRGGRTPRSDLQTLQHNLNATKAALFPSLTKPGSPTAQLSQMTQAPSKRLSDSPLGSCSPPPSNANPNGSVPPAPEQTEAMSLVVTPGKKKRHKVTDTRLAPRRSDSPPKMMDSPSSASLVPTYPPPLIPVSLPTSVAIPNPSLQHDLFFSHLGHSQRLAASAAASVAALHSQNLQDTNDSELPSAPSRELQIPTSVSSHTGQTSTTTAPETPFGLYLPRGLPTKVEANSTERPGSDPHSDPVTPAEPPSAPLPNPYESMAMMNFFKYINGASGASSALGLGASSPFCPRTSTPGGASHDGSATPASETSSYSKNGSVGGLGGYTSTLTPMHLRKAKLMFFYVRYPSSAILKMYFPDINFNKNNTAQLVKWFSNFREFYYIQMEKYARQAISEGIRNAEEIRVSHDSELLRVLNLHYNRNNHIDVPENFRFVVEQTLREFFKSILTGKDQEQSWKKAIYKIIARLDDNVPEYFKSPNFLEQLE